MILVGDHINHLPRNYSIVKHGFLGKTHSVLFSEQSSSRYILHLEHEKAVLDICTVNCFDIFIHCQKCTSYVDEFVCLGSRGSTSGGGGLGLEGNLVI